MSWTDLLNSAVYSTGSNIPFIDLTNDDSFGINTWTSAEPTSSRHASEENGWISTLTPNDRSGLRMEESQSRPNNVHHLENPNYNLINNQVDGNIVHNRSSNHFDNSSRSMNATENPFNACTLSRKRKGIDGSNTSGSSSSVYQGQSSSTHHPLSSHQNANTALRIGPPNLEPSQYHVNGSQERSNRNRRVRVNPPNQWDQINNRLPSNQEINSQFGSLNISGPSSTNLTQNMHPLSRNVHPLSMNTTPNSRIVNSSTMLHNTSTMHRNTGIGNHFPSSAHANLSNPMIRGQTMTILNPFGYPRITQQVGGQRVPPQFAASQNIGVPPQSGSSNINSHGLSSQILANLTSSIQGFSVRDGNASVTPELSASRSQRRRIFAEHSQNEPTRRERLVSLEDLLILNRIIVRGRPVESRDRHRDMRLDVDNMSYEELLELEERIGNVNTGLDEEKIMKCLKRRIYISLEENPIDAEPCCICQEMFVEEENVGRLKCGHDFHTACIKEWLMRKNSCPICKKAGLAQ